MKLSPYAEEGVVSENCVYTLEAIADRLGVGDAWLRSQRREGLRICYAGRRGFLLGRDLAEHLIRMHEKGWGTASTGGGK